LPKPRIAQASGKVFMPGERVTNAGITANVLPAQAGIQVPVHSFSNIPFTVRPEPCPELVEGFVEGHVLTG